MPSGRDSFRRNRVAPMDFFILSSAPRGGGFSVVRFQEEQSCGTSAPFRLMGGNRVLHLPVKQQLGTTVRLGR
jgi:hypothetical protein